MRFFAFASVLLVACAGDAPPDMSKFGRTCVDTVHQGHLSYCVYRRALLVDGILYMPRLDSSVPPESFGSRNMLDDNLNHFRRGNTSGALPHRSFIKVMGYRSNEEYARMWQEAVEAAPGGVPHVRGGPAALFSFDFIDSNLFHWAESTLPAFTFRVECEEDLLPGRVTALLPRGHCGQQPLPAFTHAFLVGHTGPHNDWQNSTLRLATGNAPVTSTQTLHGSVVAVESLVVFGERPHRIRGRAGPLLTHPLPSPPRAPQARM